MYLCLTRFAGSDEVSMKTLKTSRDCFESSRLALDAIEKPFSMEFYRFNEDDPTELGVFLFSVKNYQDEKVS